MKGESTTGGSLGDRTDRQTAAAGRYVRRFSATDRVIHFFIMSTFLGLALTGVPLLFAAHDWAHLLARLMGGFRSAAVIHRICASIMLVTFLTHVLRIGKRLFVDREWDLLYGSKTMLPRMKDITDLLGNVKWFLGLGPRPKFDRYTYWEKFDYWAVFWGMAIIGGSGLMLWFPKFFAGFLPGSAFNIALIVHGEEALLAVGFIFTVHFFNGHIRPEKFPMDMVIFTGVVEEDELRHERPEEYDRLVRTGRLPELQASAPARPDIIRGRVVGTIAVLLGLIVVGFMFVTAVAF